MLSLSFLKTDLHCKNRDRCGNCERGSIGINGSIENASIKKCGVPPSVGGKVSADTVMVVSDARAPAGSGQLVLG